MITARSTFSPRYASASAFSFCRIMAEISGGLYQRSPILTSTPPFDASRTLYGTSLRSFWTCGSLNLRPMNRLIEKTVFSGLVTAWRRANRPTSRSPLRADRHHRRGQALAFRVRDDDRLATFDGGHHRVGRSEVDTNHSCHRSDFLLSAIPVSMAVSLYALKSGFGAHLDHGRAQ